MGGVFFWVRGYVGGPGWGRHLKFETRVQEAMRIAQMVKLNSMMDISDGLSSDLKRICTQSKVGAVIDAQRIPISDEAARARDPLGAALNDGEDFELLFTLSPRQCRRLLDAWSGSLPITVIGEIASTPNVRIRRPNGRVCNLPAGGYDHLKN